MMVVLLPPRPPPPRSPPPPPPPPRERTWQRNSVFDALSTCPCSMTTKSYGPWETVVVKKSGVSSAPPPPNIHQPAKPSPVTTPNAIRANVSVFPWRRKRRAVGRWSRQKEAGIGGGSCA